MRFRRPEPLLLLLTLCVVALLVGLGVWQVNRLAWKTDLLAHIATQQAKPPLVTLPQDLQGLDYRNVRLTGEFLYDKTLQRAGGMQFEDAGFFLITPFKLAGDGRIILVNRGFAPGGKALKPAGEQTVSGIIRPLVTRRIFSPHNIPDKNIWFYEDVPAMAKATGLTLTPLAVEAVGKKQPGVYPIPSNGRIFIYNHHLQYIITWFSLAVIAIVMFVLYHRVPEDEAKA